MYVLRSHYVQVKLWLEALSFRFKNLLYLVIWLFVGVNFDASSYLHETLRIGKFHETSHFKINAFILSLFSLYSPLLVIVIIF